MAEGMDPIPHDPDRPWAAGMPAPEPLIPPASREPALLLALGIVMFLGLLALAWFSPRNGSPDGTAVQSSVTARSLTYMVELARYHQARGSLPADVVDPLAVEAAARGAEEWLAVSRSTREARLRGLTALNAAALYGTARQPARARAALDTAAARDAARASAYRSLRPLYDDPPRAATPETRTSALLDEISAGPLVRARLAELRGERHAVPGLLADGARAGMRLLTVNLSVVAVLAILIMAGILVLSRRRNVLGDDLNEPAGTPGPEVPWGIGTALMVISTAYLGANLLGTLVLTLLPAGMDGREIIAGLFATAIGPLAVLAVFLPALGQAPWAWAVLGWRRARQGLGFGLVVMLLCLPVVLAATVVSQSLLGDRPDANPIIPQMLTTRNPLMMLVMGMAATVMAPVLEETLFRGLLFRALHVRLPFWSAAVVSGLLFALVHHQLAAILPITLLGTLLALLTRRTHSLLAAVGAHAGYNGFVMLVLLLTSWALRGPGG